MNAPLLSVVVATDGAEAIGELVHALRRQSRADTIELVVAAPPTAGIHPGDDLFRGIGRVVVAPVPSVSPIARARAAGALAASAEIVFIGETHALPEPRWAEELLAGHREASRVSACLVNANPDGALSEAAFLLDYGRRTPAAPAGPLARAPIYNATYPRRWLQEHAQELDSLMDPYLQNAAGAPAQETAVLAPRARMAHINVSRPAHWVHERYVAGRLVGAARARNWSRGRRMLQVAGTPLVPFVLMRRQLPALRARGASPPPPRLTLAAAALSLTLRAVGEGVSCLLGPGRAARSMDRFEIHKRRYARRPRESASVRRGRPPY